MLTKNIKPLYHYWCLETLTLELSTIVTKHKYNKNYCHQLNVPRACSTEAYSLCTVDSVL